jgi:hypothetical protein
VPYVEPLSEARTPLADFSCILLGRNQNVCRRALDSRVVRLWEQQEYQVYPDGYGMSHKFNCPISICTADCIPHRARTLAISIQIH